MTPSLRLRRLCALIPEGCACAADIGTDHGYLPILALESGRAGRMIAADVRPGPLKKAEENIREAGLLSRVSLRLSDGFEKVLPGEASCAVIAGMGGELMARILEEGKTAVKETELLILSPQTEPFLVRSWLSENGFQIRHEEFLKEDGKTYLILTAAPGEEALTEAERIWGPRLLEKRDETLRARLLKEKKRIRDLLARLSEREGTEKRREELEKEKALLGKALAYYGDE